MVWLKLAFCVGCVVVLFKGSSALQCYECTETDDGCQDEFVKSGNIQKKDCSLLATACAKTKSQNKVTSRGCAIGILDDDCAEALGEIICYCSGDLCNGSTTVTASISIMTALVLVVGIFTWV